MENDCLQSMIQLLRDLDILEPIPTGLLPVVLRDDSIRAVIFDIYGTLLISESGDIDESNMTTEHLKYAFQKAHIELEADSSEEEHQILRHLLRGFTLSIKQRQRLHRKKGVTYPEVNIIEIWEEVIHCAMNQHLVKSNGYDKIKCLTFIFEVLSNQVYPMPGMEEIITGLNSNGAILGIVSNAQFYTPIIMNYFLYRRHQDDFIAGIDPSLQVYSYKEQIAKPDVKLYEKIAASLAAKRLAPEECLFIGNDMLNDIYAARQVGFKTALFAGDKRSLRLRENMPLVRGIKPDFILTELAQLYEVLP